MPVPRHLELSILPVEIYFGSAVKSATLARQTTDMIAQQHGHLKWLDLYWESVAWDAGDEIDPDPEELENIDEAVARLAELIGVFLQSVFATDVFAVMTLEAFVNGLASDMLGGSMLDQFDRLSLEGKWLFLPRLVGRDSFDPGREPFQGFRRLVRRRNAHVHTKKDEPLHVVGGDLADEFLRSRLSQIDDALATVRGLITQISTLLGTELPNWVQEGELAYYHLREIEN